MRRSDRPRADAAIPTASFADIAFLLLVFFMVTAVFSTTARWRSTYACSGRTRTGRGVPDALRGPAWTPDAGRL